MHGVRRRKARPASTLWWQNTFVERVREGKELLERVYAMLTKLIERFESDD